MASATIELELPKLAGSRLSAQEFLSELPDDLTMISVLIDCSYSAVAAQGYVDELCKGILELRGAAMLMLKSPSEDVLRNALRSVNLRSVGPLGVERARAVA